MLDLNISLPNINLPIEIWKRLFFIIFIILRFADDLAPHQNGGGEGPPYGKEHLGFCLFPNDPDLSLFFWVQDCFCDRLFSFPVCPFVCLCLSGCGRPSFFGAGRLVGVVMSQLCLGHDRCVYSSVYLSASRRVSAGTPGGHAAQ